MPEIKAFRAWRYNKKKTGRLESVLAPPYDVISKKEQGRLYRKSPYNVVRLILGKERPVDGAADNKYTRAARLLSRWKAEQVLTQDQRPSLYIYRQDYKEDGRSQSRYGFVAAMKLDDRAVLRHENTLASPKKDRMALLKQVRANLSPIFGLFEDRPAAAQKLLVSAANMAPAVDVTLDGVRHRLYVESRPERIQKLIAVLRTKPMLIADGHHRFEVACQFKDWMQSRFPLAKDESWHYVMTYFSDCLHNPFKIYPTHRLVRVPKKGADVWKALQKRGRLEKAGGLGAVLRRLAAYRVDTREKAYNFGVYSKKEGFFIFTLAREYATRVRQNPVDRLDVAVLHQMVVEPCFGIRAIEKSAAIDFTRDAEEACQKIKSGEFDMALFLRPTSLNEMILASKKGLKMPQKSTYFYPKLLSGTAFHSFS